ncbi:MAG TPA: CDP-alcohol phosphatidyltransferase family protein [Mycobacteriales bacterium]|nr:CDP-alcohol phosphatidyltransferase family protein [Mycobacteriales bacterium]
MLNKARAPIGRAVAPVVRGLARTPLTANGLTILGTLGAVGGSLLLADGRLFVGTLVVWGFVMFDMLDGQLAKARGGATVWGALLDSTLDRITDGAVFAAVVWHFGRDRADQPWIAGLALFCLVSGAVVSYVKARAEGLGLRCDVGVAERAERLILVLVGTGLTGLGVPFVLPVLLWVLAAASAFTVVQRMVFVRAQAVALR